MPTNNERPGERRIIMRRSRGQGVRFSGGGRVDGAPRDPVIDDEVDDSIDPDTYVRNLSRAPAPGTPPPGGGTGLRNTLTKLDAAGSAAYSREHRMVLLHKMLMRKTPLHEIAEAMGVSVSTIEKDRVRLKAWMREQAKDMNIDEMIGNNNALYDEITAMALRVASKTGDGGVPVAMQLAGMRTALAAKADQARFLTSTGVLDVLRFRKADTGEAQSDIQRLMEQTGDLLRGLMDEELGMGSFDAFDERDITPESEDL